MTGGARRPSRAEPGSASGYRGASAGAIRHHYDTGNAFYGLWLDPTLTYSCALWDERTSDDELEAAQVRKLDLHVAQARAAGKDRVLEIGCGWGSLLTRLVGVHGVGKAVGLTLSAAQAQWVREHADRRIEVREENWFDHVPESPYGAVLCVAAMEAFARPGMPEAEKIAAYRSFFERCHEWLVPGGWLSVQTVAWGHGRPEDSSGFIETRIFPESDLPRLAELARAADRLFEIVSLSNDREGYARTLRVWQARLRAVRPRAVQTAGEETVARYEKYLKVARIGFHTGRLHLYRIALRRIDQPWA